MPEFIDALKRFVNEGVISSAVALKSLPGIRSCPTVLDILIVEINL